MRRNTVTSPRRFPARLTVLAGLLAVVACWAAGCSAERSESEGGKSGGFKVGDTGRFVFQSGSGDAPFAVELNDRAELNRVFEEGDADRFAAMYEEGRVIDVHTGDRFRVDEVRDVDGLMRVTITNGKSKGKSAWTSERGLEKDSGG